MAFPHTKPHLASLLDMGSARQGTLITHSHGRQTKPLRLTYSKLRTLVTSKAELLARCDAVRPGRVALIHFKSHLENIIWFWASILAGCVPAMSTPLVNHEEGRKAHFRHLHSLLLDPIVVTTRDLSKSDFADNTLLQLLSVEDVESQTLDRSVAMPDINRSIFSNTVVKSQRANDATTPEDRASKRVKQVPTSNDEKSGSLEASSLKDVAALMLTSGSTGHAKAVCLTHMQIFAAIEGKLSGMPLPSGSALMNWIGLDHVASLIEIHLCAMYAGIDQVHIPAADVLGDPILFLRLISEHNVSRTFAPNFLLHKLCEALDSASAQQTLGIDLECLRYVASGGEPNDVRTCAQVTEHFRRLGAQKKNVVIPGFGMTETCAGAIFNFDCPNIDTEAGSEFTALGKCVPGIEMRVSPIDSTNSEDLAVSSDQREGSLEIRGPIVFEKYFNNEQATKDSFTPDGWFKTGDLAIIDTAGNLKLVGRSKELLIVNGVKYLPHEVESAIQQANIEGVAHSFVVCLSHRKPASNTEDIIIVYQHEYDSQDGQARANVLRSIVRTVALIVGARPRVLPLPPGRMEKTTLGKLSRTKIQSSLAQGQYEDQENLNAQILRSCQESSYSKPQNEVEQKLMNLFQETLGLDDIDMGTNTDVLNTGVSSVDLIRLKTACETAFGIREIPMITILTNTTVRSLAAAIQPLQNSETSIAKYNPVITLQGNGSKTPLWLIHPGIGEILVFLGLVQFFPDRPIYAFRARGFSPGEKPFKGLSDVVNTYYTALKQQQPHGPYAIAGYSYGSMLAFEISKLLESEGEEVRFLGSFNLPPHIKERMRMLDWSAGLLHIAHFCGIIPESRAEALVGQLRGLARPEAQVATVLAESDPKRCAELALTSESLLTWTNVAWSMQEIGQEYEPTGSVSHMDVFYCQPLKVVAATRTEYRQTKLNRWIDFVREEGTEGLRFHEVDGEHYTMIGSEHVGQFQRRLKKALTARGV